jgi:OTU domain-containing protein 6
MFSVNNIRITCYFRCWYITILVMIKIPEYQKYIFVYVYVSIEEEYAVKERELMERYAQQLTLAKKEQQSSGEVQGEETKEPTQSESPPNSSIVNVDEKEEKQRQRVEQKKAKNVMKRRQAREATQKQEYERLHALASIGPSAREVEMDRLKELYLEPNNLDIVEVPADGHCLFRAIAEQLNNELMTTRRRYVEKYCYAEEEQDDDYEHILMDYKILREKCADALALYETTLAPFCEYEDSFQNYVARIRSSADAWGGHVELRALSQALNRTIIVYSASAPPLIMNGISSLTGDEVKEEEEAVTLSTLSASTIKEPLRVSYHRHYYALGEHYNCVVVRKNTISNE